MYMASRTPLIILLSLVLTSASATGAALRNVARRPSTGAMLSSADLATAARPRAALVPRAAGSLYQSADVYELQGGLTVVVVSRQEQLRAALQSLRQAAAHSAAVAIDLEWRPDFRPGSNNPVT